MTKRALILGLLGAVLMGVYGQYAGKYVPGIWGLVRGYMPVSIYGFMILAVMVLNPLIGKTRASWRLQPRELGIIFALTLVACGITDGGLMRSFPRMLIHPVIENQNRPGWQKADALGYTPPVLLANGGRYDRQIVDGYRMPMGSRGAPIPISAVPWHAWWKPLAFWTPMILLTMLAVVSLSVLVHRQWSDRERLRYPLAEMAFNLSAPTLYPACIGVAFLMATDISFSLGIANFVSVLLLYFMISNDLGLGGNDNWGGVSEWMSFGSFLAMGLMLLYMGRHFYWHTLREAITFRPQPDTESHSVWACRGFLVCVLGVIGMLIWLGFESMMPFAVTGLKVACDTGLKPGRMGLAFAAVILVVIALVVPTGLWADYNHAPPMDRGGTGAEIYGRVERVVTQLSLTGELEKVQHYTTWARLKNMQPQSGFLVSAAIGFGLLLAFSAMRMRFTWWPLHPVLLLWLSASTYVGRFSLSFLLGCGINRDTYLYFGNPLYEYSLRQGIEDGFLAPYRVHRIVTEWDAAGWRPSQTDLDRYGRPIPDEEYQTKDFERVVALRARTAAIARHLTEFLKQTDRFAKTIVFCVDQEHGDAQFLLPDVLKVPPLSTHGTVNDIIRHFGGADQLRNAVNQLQSLLYAA